MPEEASYTEQVEREAEVVDRNADQIKGTAEKHTGIGRLLNLGSVANSKEIAAGRILTRRLADLARLREQISSGAVKATKFQREGVDLAAERIYDMLAPGTDQTEDIEALAKGVGTSDPDADGKRRTVTAAQALSEYDKSPEQFLRDNLDLAALSTEDAAITDDRAGGLAMKNANAALAPFQTKQPSAPATPAGTASAEAATGHPARAAWTVTRPRPTSTP